LAKNDNTDSSEPKTRGLDSGGLQSLTSGTDMFKNAFKKLMVKQYKVDLENFEKFKENQNRDFNHMKKINFKNTLSHSKSNYSGNV
jgi:hypothetical protein